MLNGNDMAVHRKKRGMRQRLTEVLRTLAKQQHRSSIAQVFYDLACGIDLTGPIDQSRLPATPDGFVVKNTTALKSRNMSNTIMCLYQIVSMMVLYYWLYAATADAQDARSCERYLSWLEEYTKAPEAYDVIQDKNLVMYLYPLKGIEDKPHVPEWLGEETV